MGLGLALIVLALGSSSCALWTWLTRPSIELQVLCFNIRNGHGRDGDNRWELRRELVAQVMRDSKADVMGLQEAYKFQLDYLLGELPQYAAVGIGRDGGDEGELSPILYLKESHELLEHGTFWLSGTPELPSADWGNSYRRICTWARLKDLKTGRAFYAYNTHFDHESQPARERSARLIMRRIAGRAHPRDPFIFCGDFNAAEDNPVLTYLKGQCGPDDPNPIPLVDSWRVIHPQNPDSGTVSRFEGSRERYKIDYIFVAQGTQVLDAHILRTRYDGRDPSDHYPVTAYVLLK